MIKLGNEIKTKESKRNERLKDIFIIVGIILTMVITPYIMPILEGTVSQPKQSASDEYYNKVINQRKAEIKKEKESEVRVLKKGIELLEEERAKVAIMKELLKDVE